MAGTHIPLNESDKRREFILHTVNGKPCAEEYYMFVEGRGWNPVSPEEGERWDKKTVNFREIKHDTMPKFRKTGLIGREKIVLISDNGPDFVKPKEEEENETVDKK